MLANELHTCSLFFPHKSNPLLMCANVASSYSVSFLAIGTTIHWIIITFWEVLHALKRYFELERVSKRARVIQN